MRRTPRDLDFIVEGAGSADDLRTWCVDLSDFGTAVETTGFGGCHFTIAGVQVDMWRVEDNRIGLLRADPRHRTIADVLQRGVTLTTDRGAVVLGRTASVDADLSAPVREALASGELGLVTPLGMTTTIVLVRAARTLHSLGMRPRADLRALAMAELPHISDRSLERALQFQTRPDDITPAQVRALLLG